MVIVNEILSSPKLEGIIQTENREEGRALREKLREAIAKLDSIPTAFAASPINLENPAVAEAIEKKAHTLAEELRHIETNLGGESVVQVGVNSHLNELEERRNGAFLAEAEALKLLNDARIERQSIKVKVADVEGRYMAAAMDSGEKRKKRLDEGFKPKINGKYESSPIEIGKARIDGKTICWEKSGHKTKEKQRHRLPISVEYHSEENQKLIKDLANIRQKVQALKADYEKKKAELEKVQGELNLESHSLQDVTEISTLGEELQPITNENAFQNAYVALEEVKRIEELMQEFQQQASSSRESLVNTQKRLLDLIEKVHIE